MNERQRDLSGWELALIVPLALLLVGLSAWPAGITERSFALQPTQVVQTDLGGTALQRPGSSAVSAQLGRMLAAERTSGSAP